MYASETENGNGGGTEGESDKWRLEKREGRIEKEDAENKREARREQREAAPQRRRPLAGIYTSAPQQRTAPNPHPRPIPTLDAPLDLYSAPVPSPPSASECRPPDASGYKC